MEKLCGIYKIENLINGDMYIGQSINLIRRKTKHFSELRNKKHRNKHLERAFHKYGEENFEFKILLYCEPEELTYYEQSLVDLWNPEYNICRECVTNSLGLKHTEEELLKMSIGNKGKTVSEESRKKMSEARIGKFCGDKNHRFGIPVSEETKQKISKSLMGMKASEETKAKMSKAHLSIDNGRRIKKEIIQEIRNLLDKKMTIKEIAKITGVGLCTVKKVKRGGYKNIYGI
jgi:group I intron endonuclease